MRRAAAATAEYSAQTPALPPKPPPTWGVTTRTVGPFHAEHAGQLLGEPVGHLRRRVEREPAVVGSGTATHPFGSIGTTATRWFT